MRHAGDDGRKLARRGLERGGIAAIADKLARDLSFPERARGEVARALCTEPRILLLDEPLSALDQDLRVRLREELAEMLERVQVPTLLVSHDPQDVQALAQSVVRIANGRVAGAQAVPAALA